MLGHGPHQTLPQYRVSARSAMCGISAIIALADPPQDGHRLRGDEKEVVLTREMEDSLQLIKHRGPDFSGIWVSTDQRIGMTSPSLVCGHKSG